MQLAPKVLAADGSTPSLSEEIDCLAFTASGLVSDALDPTAGGAFKLLIAEAYESLRQSMRISFNRVENQGTKTSSLFYRPLAWPDTNEVDSE